jgi:hypothetical protein
MIEPYQITIYDGNFYRFFDENGSPHTMAGERDFNLIKAKVKLVVPLIKKYGFTMCYYGQFHKDSWQVFNTASERSEAAIEYFEKVCKPLNEAFLKRPPQDPSL